MRRGRVVDEKRLWLVSHSLCAGHDYAEVYQRVFADHFIAQCAEVFVACLEFLLLCGSAVERSYFHAILADSGLHSHQDVREAVVVDVCADRPAESRATHCGGDHLDREVSRALERAAPSEVDDILSALDHAHLDILPVFLGETFSADDFGERLAVDRSRGCAGESSQALRGWIPARV